MAADITPTADDRPIGAERQDEERVAAVASEPDDLPDQALRAGVDQLVERRRGESGGLDQGAADADDPALAHVGTPLASPDRVT